MSNGSDEVKFRKIARVCVVSIAGVGGLVAVFVLSWVALTNTEGFIFNQLKDNIRAIVGLPLAVVLAFFVVSVLEAGSSEPIAFKAIGFDFKGASGPVVLWIACFLAVVLALRLLW